MSKYTLDQSRFALVGKFFAIFAITLTFSLLVGGGYASAQASQQPKIDLQKAAEEFCDKSGSPDGKAACRQGFREGFKGDQGKTAACDSPSYSAGERTRCGAGWEAGKSQSTSGGTATGQSGSTSNASVFATGSKNFQCGNTKDAVKTKFNLGCLGTKAPPNTAPIQDMVYTIIRFLSAGVGIIIVLSIIAAGIQYSASEGNPEATQASKTRIQNSVIGLLIYIFAFSFIQYLVPGGLFAGSMIMAEPVYMQNLMERF